MAIFSYKALSANGSVTTGELDAADRNEALRRLERKGLQPVQLKQSGAAAAKAAAAKASGKPKADAGPESFGEGPVKLKRAEVVLFTEELSDMLGAGLQLEPALKAMEGRQELGNLKEVSWKIRQIVRDGSSFSSALRRVSPSFGPLYCSLAAAGEASGALDTILKRQAHYLKTLADLRAKLILAMIYPSLLVTAGIGLAVVCVTVLIPQLLSLLESTPGSTPTLGIAILMFVSGFLTKWWLAMVLAIVAAVIFFKAWLDNPANKPTWDRAKLSLPLFGRVVSSRFYVQFLAPMANLVGHGLPLLRALELSRDATENAELRKHLDKVIDQVGDGRALSSALIRTEAFPPLLIDMVSVGERTGKIEQSLRRAAERFDRELDNSLQRIMALITPVVLIVIAALVGVMAYMIIMSILQTLSSMS
ncbi:MAG: type II secretion system F family protein [Luteolibacter sp.]